MKKTLQKRNFIVRPYTEMQNLNRYTLFFQERFVTTYVVFSDLLADDNSPGMVNKISFLIEGNDKTIARGNIALMYSRIPCTNTLLLQTKNRQRTYTDIAVRT